MKNNELAYKLFAAALIGMLLILALCSCTDEPEPTPTGIKFHAKTKADTLATTYYFQVSCGDSVQPNGILIADTTFIVGQYGELPRDIEILECPYKYAQMYAFYQSCGNHFIPCCMFANHNGTNIYESCTSGVSRAFEL